MKPGKYRPSRLSISITLSFALARTVLLTALEPAVSYFLLCTGTCKKPLECSAALIQVWFLKGTGRSRLARRRRGGAPDTSGVANCSERLLFMIMRTPSGVIILPSSVHDNDKASVTRPGRRRSYGPEGGLHASAWGTASPSPGRPASAIQRHRPTCWLIHGVTLCVRGGYRGAEAAIQTLGRLM